VRRLTPGVRRIHPRTDAPTAPPAGECRPERAVVDCAVYDQGQRIPGRPSPGSALAAAREQHDRFVWVGLFEPTDEEFAVIAREFGLHPLAVEDAVQAHQRPKLDRYGDTLFAVFKTARYVAHDELTGSTEVVATGEVMLFVGPEFVVSVRHGDVGALGVVRERLQRDHALLAQGPASVLYAVADRVVDDYEVVGRQLQDDLDEVEGRVFSSLRGEDSQRVYQLKRELLEFKRAVVPLARPLAQLAGGEVASIPAEVQTYLRDVQDNQLRVMEQVAGFDDLLGSILQSNLTQLALQQNDDMRKMSAWLAIIAVPTAVTGFFGQNVPYPGFGKSGGFWFSVVFMAALASYLYVVFKRKKWL
jgi:magnesium transporter